MKITIRNIVALILPIIAVLAFSGCNGNSNTNTSNSFNRAAFITGPETPWNDPLYIDGMNDVFGPENWDKLDMNDLNASEAFTNGMYEFIYLDGSDDYDGLLETFIDSHGSKIENFVNVGGRLLINSSGQGAYDNLYIGFNDLNISYDVFSDNVIATDEDHPIWSGPYTPVVTSYTGDSFSHSVVTKTGMTSIITGDTGDDAEGQIILGEFQWGSGYVLAGGMTAVKFHDPSDNNESMNLYKNILSYAAGL